MELPERLDLLDPLLRLDRILRACSHPSVHAKLLQEMLVRRDLLDPMDHPARLETTERTESPETRVHVETPECLDSPDRPDVLDLLVSLEATVRRLDLPEDPEPLDVLDHLDRPAPLADLERTERLVKLDHQVSLAALDSPDRTGKLDPLDPTETMELLDLAITAPIPVLLLDIKFSLVNKHFCTRLMVLCVCSSLTVRRYLSY